MGTQQALPHATLQHESTTSFTTLWDLQLSAIDGDLAIQGKVSGTLLLSNQSNHKGFEIGGNERQRRQ